MSGLVGERRNATSEQVGAASLLFPADDVTGSHSVNGFLGGGQVGFNYQAGWAVWGVEAQADWSNLKGFGSCFPDAAPAGVVNPNGQVSITQILGVFSRCSSNVRSLGTIAARFGATVDRSMVFVKGGWAWANDRFSLQSSTLPGLPFTDLWKYGDISDWRGGLMVGAGVEYALSPNWSAKVEYDYLSLGTKNYTFAGTFIPAPGFPIVGATLPVALSTDITQNIHLIKFGINYRFGWGGSVVANY
jgi:outer membrane immunogenic protein